MIKVSGLRLRARSRAIRHRVYAGAPFRLRDVERERQPVPSRRPLQATPYIAPGYAKEKWMARGTPEPTAARVGAQIRRIRTGRGMTLQELSDAAGLGGRGNASNLEQGKVAPTVATLARVAAALGVSMAGLMPPDPVDRARLHALVARSLRHMLNR